MTLEMIGIVVLAVAVFGFVLGPILRARPDQVVIDSIALPRPVESLIDDDYMDVDEGDRGDPEVEHRALRQTVIEQPASGDAS